MFFFSRLVKQIKFSLSFVWLCFIWSSFNYPGEYVSVRPGSIVTRLLAYSKTNPKSLSVSVNRGVPQGTVLVPIFSVMVNDLTLSLCKLKEIFPLSFFLFIFSIRSPWMREIIGSVDVSRKCGIFGEDTGNWKREEIKLSAGCQYQYN